MSMRSYESRGWGVQFKIGGSSATTVDKIRTLLNLAPELKNDIEQWFEDCEINPSEVTVQDYAEYDQDYYCGIAYILAKAMNEHYDCEFMSAESDEDGFLYVYMPCAMPWELHGFAQTLTEEKFVEVLTKFYNILYDDVPDIGFVSVNNFG